MKNLPDHYSEGSTATSRAAHATIDKQSQRDVVYAWWLKQPRGATLYEASAAIEWKGRLIGYSAISARVQELRAEGRLRRLGWKPPQDMGRKRRNPSGRLAYIYITQESAGNRYQAALEYEEQIRLERGEKCPACGGTGYLKQAQASLEDDLIVQKALWR